MASSVHSLSVVAHDNLTTTADFPEGTNCDIFRAISVRLRPQYLGLTASAAFHKHLRQSNRQWNGDILHKKLVAWFSNLTNRDAQHYEATLYNNVLTLNFWYLNSATAISENYYNHSDECKNTKPQPDGETLCRLPWSNSGIVNRKINHGFHFPLGNLYRHKIWDRVLRTSSKC
jgi:hypothetical protein